MADEHIEQPPPSLGRRLRTALFGEARDLNDHGLFHKLSLVAFLAWVGLGADGLSSTCYGPEEAFLLLQGHLHLGLLVAVATVLTILVISASYTQLIELFPSGGGGYLVASKLISPNAGMVSGCALLIDYVLTIAVSIASGADALFSFLPVAWQPFKLWVAVGGVTVLMMLNLRGVRESVLPLIPIFLLFVFTHGVAILYALLAHVPELPTLARETSAEFGRTHQLLGWGGMLLLLVRAYSMGAGTYTGIEAVSNALPMLREPRVDTARRTMRYMAISLSVTAMGIMLAYVFYRVAPQPGRTLNAVLLGSMTAGWGSAGPIFVLLTLVSEAVLLFIAAQSGFFGGPRVLANMAQDHWVPSRFAMLSDRLVTSHGIGLMGGAALVTLLLTHGSVQMLVVLYSINVFITFALSQLGLVRHWWSERAAGRPWRRPLAVSGIGLVLTVLILVCVSVIKFFEGGWVTLLVTTGLVLAVRWVRRYYGRTHRLLKRLDTLVEAAVPVLPAAAADRPAPAYDPKAKTAVLMVGGFNGLGLHTLFTVMRLFGSAFKNFVFVQIGVIDAGNFKGQAEIGRLEQHVADEVRKYTDYMNSQGYFAEGFTAVGTDVVDEMDLLARQISARYPQAVYFGGQLAFKEESLLSRWLHNQIVFAAQRRLHHQGLPFVILPIRV